MNINNRHFPEWVEQNSLFRKLFLLRKLFLTKRKSVHYSQFAEDVSILRQFPSNYRGFYVDVGCFHPVKYSNTYALYKRGWEGINVDIDAIKIEGFNLLRKRDVNVACAVSDQSGEVEYYSAGFFSLINTLEKDFTGAGTGYKPKRTAVRRLDEIIAGTRFSGRPIDLLTVDVESHDLKVLASLDFERYRPKVVVVETHVTSLDDLLREDLYRFLDSHGYALSNWCGLSVIFRLRGWGVQPAASAA